jgi:uncharacterized protein (DUF58 family)
VLQAVRQTLSARAAAWARKRQGDDQLPISVHGRRLYILPTRSGAGFAFLLFFMLLAGLNYNNSMALIVTFLLAGFMVVGMHLTHRNLLGLRVVAVSTVDGFAGESGKVMVTVANDGEAPRPLVIASIEASYSTAVDVPASDVRRLEIDIPLARRGVFPVARIRIATRFPFGLFEAWTWLHVQSTILAYPVPRGERTPPDSSRVGSATHALHRAGDDEWSTLRPFRDGDSPRQVAWRAYARGGDLLVREYESPAGDQRVFTLDALAHLPLEAALEQLAAWIVGAHSRGDRFGLELGQMSLAPTTGLAHRDRCLAALARFDARGRA